MTNSTTLDQKDWQTTPDIEEAQKQLVQAFTTAPVLRYFDLEEPAIVETNDSDFALGGILSQKNEGRLHPIAFHSRKFTEAQINYDTADKELLAIVDCFKRWRQYLEGAKHQVEVISDHQNLELFQMTKVLNRRQVVLTTVRTAAVRRGSLAHPTKFFQTSSAIKYMDLYATQM